VGSHRKRAGGPGYLGWDADGPKKRDDDGKLETHDLRASFSCPFCSSSGPLPSVEAPRMWERKPANEMKARPNCSTMGAWSQSSSGVWRAPIEPPMHGARDLTLFHDACLLSLPTAALKPPILSVILPSMTNLSKSGRMLKNPRVSSLDLKFDY
jgi:hypothetical protein